MAGPTPTPNPTPSPTPTPSPSSSPSPTPPMSIVGLIISRLIAVCIAFLFFHYVFDDKCGDKYKGIGTIGRISKEFQENGTRNGVLIFLYILVNLSYVYRGYSEAKTDAEKSTVIENGGITALLDLLSALVIVGALLNKCRSPLWAFIPALILVILISLIVMGAVSTLR